MAKPLIWFDHNLLNEPT